MVLIIQDVIDYVTISSLGNALILVIKLTQVESHAGCSNGHGGLG